MCGILITKSPDSSKIDHRGKLTVKVGKAYGYNMFQSILPIQTANIMFNADWKELAIVNTLYNGEIYNFNNCSDVENLAEIIADIKSKSNDDYKTFVKEFVSVATLFDGMFAIVTQIKDRLICITDVLGKKQLYYNDDCEIASEIAPLINKDSKPDKIYQAEVLKWGYNSNEHTPWTNIHRMKPGTVYIVNLSQKEVIQTQWHLIIEPDAKPLREILLNSVTGRLKSNVPIACLLSGGLDSSIIAWILHLLEVNVTYYAIPDSFNESVLTYFEQLGLKINRLYGAMTMLGQSFNDLELQKALVINDGPVDLGSVRAEITMCKQVKEDVIITGDGADELFGGYKRMSKYDAQYSDIFDELTYYHLPRLDRASMHFTKELRSPYLSAGLISAALALPYEDRIDKKALREAFKNFVPDLILDMPKIPLKSKDQDEDNVLNYRKRCIKLYYNYYEDK